MVKKHGQKTKKLQRTFFNETTLIVVLLLIAIITSTVFRLYPAHLPATQDWAQESFYGQIEANVAQQINQQYPNLPNSQKQKLIDKEVQKVVANQGESLQGQIDRQAEYFASRLQNENNDTYLLAIDPYHWLNYAENIEEHGMIGDEMVDGKSSFSLRNGREPKGTGLPVHPWLTVQVHRIGSAFSNNFTLQRAAFMMPVILIALALIPAFFLARKIGGNIAGFVAAMALALNTALLSRTPAGFSDTDTYIILFPLLISWFTLEALMASKLKQKLIWSAGAGLILAFFKMTWGHWWHIGTIILGVIGIYFIYTWIRNKDFLTKRIHTSTSGHILLTGIVLLASIFIFAGLFNVLSTSTTTGFIAGGSNAVEQITIYPLEAIAIKSVGTSTIWPNVLTTVAELNQGSWKQIMQSAGGTFLFILAGIGALLTLGIKTKGQRFEIRYASLLILWFATLTIAGLMSSRFIALMAAPIAIALGAFFGLGWHYAQRALKKEFPGQEKTIRIAGLSIIALIILAIFIPQMVQAHTIAKSEVPSMNDAWHESLTSIKENCSDGVITSWWDFGHWFVNVAQRRVTFDGGGQGKRIHWVGQTLMTSSEQENIDILRMLNCGQEEGYDRIENYTGNEFEAVQLTKEITRQQPNKARQTLLEAGLSEEEIRRVLNKTHCENYLDQYYIVSTDMVGKAAVWGHFGGWDFEKAYVYNTVTRYKDAQKAQEEIMQTLTISQEQAENYYYDASALTTNQAVDSWISPWPNYVTQQAAQCETNNNNTHCSLQQVIQQQGNNAAVIESISISEEHKAQVVITTYANGMKQGSQTLTAQALTYFDQGEWKTKTTENQQLPYNVVYAQGKAIIAEPSIADSMFSKLYFFDGLGLEHYTQLHKARSFTGETIIVYKVDLNR